ncbi:tetratricopeptide repeat protein [Chondromyces apiculatus]|uniref:tetratricopeptide repeat protein n=1 Tax=Chondromyces apiculatus TaxID=51 RepID=UPI001E3B0732|nr:tetratricopeptide repeat protein [Chondromyces apiculatus]
MPAATLVLTALLSLPLSLPLAGSAGPSLTAAAAAAGRPPECSLRTRRPLGRGPTVWERARIPSLQRYCDLIARAHAQLATDPRAARDAAVLAAKELPGHAAPAVVHARALLALGSATDAAPLFEQARKLDPRSVEDPSTMYDLARTLRLTGKHEDALVVYRALVPRLDLLGPADRRVATLLEAAHVAMAVAAAPPANAKDAKDEARARLDEAAAYLREARLRPPGQLTGDVLLSLALVLDRSGDRALADAALDSASEVGARTHASSYLVAEEDALALDALSLERSDPATASARWQAFLGGKGGKGPWASAAQARVARLGTTARTAPRAAATAPRRPGAAAQAPAAAGRPAAAPVSGKGKQP